MTFLDTPSGMHLLWLAALLLVPLAAVVAGRGLVVRYMDSQLELAKARAGTDWPCPQERVQVIC
jgi:hypothetical protein